MPRVDRERKEEGGWHIRHVGHSPGRLQGGSPDAPSSCQNKRESPRLQPLLTGPKTDQLVQKAAEVCLLSPATP